MDSGEKRAQADWRAAELAEHQHAAIAYRQLRELGLASTAIERRVAGGRLHPRHTGVFAFGRRGLTPEGEWMAAVLAGGDEALLSHWSAAALWEILDRRDGPIHIVAPRSRHHRRGVVVHRPRSIHPDDRAICRGIPVTSVARTLLELAAVATRRTLDRAVDEADRRGLLDLDELAALLSRSYGRRGLPRMRSIIARHQSTAGTRSELEGLFLNLCAEAGLPRPLTNVEVAGFEVDAYWPDCGLVVELDGFEFHRTRAAFERDRARDVALRVAGYEVARFTYRQLRNETAAVGVALHRLRARLLEPPSSGMGSISTA